MPRDYEIFEQVLTLFHACSLQNDETVRHLLECGILPADGHEDFSILDIGAGQGYLSGLLQPYADPLVLLEPNPRCVQVLKARFNRVYPYRWSDFSRRLIARDHRQGFSLIILSHMIYHFDGVEDIRRKLRMALTLLKQAGHLVVVINQPEAPWHHVPYLPRTISSNSTVPNPSSSARCREHLSSSICLNEVSAGKSSSSSMRFLPPLVRVRIFPMLAKE